MFFSDSVVPTDQNPNIIASDLTSELDSLLPEVDILGQVKDA